MKGACTLVRVDDDDGLAGDRTAALEAQLQTALQERNTLWADAQRTRALELELAHTRAIIEEMRHSISWRLTAPIRGTKRQGQSSRKLLGRARRAVRAG